MTRRGLSEMLALLEASYPLFKLDERRVKAWLLILAPVADEEGHEAAIRLCRELLYPPKPADIWRLVEEAREARRYQAVPRPALPEPADPDTAKRWLAEIRAQITTLAAQKGMPQ